jgi:RNA polymerase sigma factor (sigma-70 family)
MSAGEYERLSIDDLAIKAFRDNDEHAWRLFEPMLTDYMYRVVHKFGLQIHDAKDIIQESWSRLLKNTRNYDSTRGSIKWYAGRTVENLCRDKFRRTKAQPSHNQLEQTDAISPGPSPIAMLVQAESQREHDQMDAISSAPFPLEMLMRPEFDHELIVALRECVEALSKQNREAFEWHWGGRYDTNLEEKLRENRSENGLRSLIFRATKLHHDCVSSKYPDFQKILRAQARNVRSQSGNLSESKDG